MVGLEDSHDPPASLRHNRPNYPLSGTRQAAAPRSRGKPPVFHQAFVTGLLARLNCSPNARVQRDVRTAVRADAAPTDRVREIRRIVVDAGLQPARAPEPLPHLEPADVHLIAWMAVKGRDAVATANGAAGTGGADADP